MGAEFVLKGLAVAKDVISRSDSGITWTSDQVTYPADLKDNLLPEDVFPKSARLLRISKEGSYDGLFASDDILFTLYGKFRAYEEVIQDDPESVITPVIADAYISYDAHWSGGKATMSKADVHFTALDTVAGTADNPKIQFLCQGHYDPAPDGYIAFEFVVEVDQEANVNLAEDRSSSDAVVTDNSPNGVQLGVAD